jgi:hypothetical protein
MNHKSCIGGAQAVDDFTSLVYPQAMHMNCAGFLTGLLNESN